MIIVHHLEQSRSFRILWALEEAGLDYQVEAYQRDPETRLAPDEARGLHPAGKFPMMELEGRVLAESGAILEAIADQAEGLRPAEGRALDDYRYWLHAAEGSVMPPLVSKYLWSRMIEKSPFFIKPVAKLLAGKADAAYLGPTIRTLLAHVEGHLAQNTWFAGDEFSMADIQMAYPVAAAQARMGGGQSMPHMTKFLERIETRLAYRAARNKGGAMLLTG
ncbi:glutathione S-transferase [Aestuariispira insulae]|uniref:Glutathione S-transferase n=1 Tax=Aestuariispira insulae TaxID=1461337 RepID=A0A3D9H9N4_9PROT|nr:glutathione S-transferase [Aestuariispira insulae]RED46189.1 glutathione S-transferase [Aestuariispira insulae]